MFKIARFEDVKNEVVNIEFVTQEKSKSENIKTLSFEIAGNNYSFSFDLNCRLEELLNMPMGQTTDFNKNVCRGETILNIKGQNIIDPQMDIKINRYLENKIVVSIIFYTDDYSGIIEFEFNLDDYLQ